MDDLARERISEMIESQRKSIAFNDALIAGIEQGLLPQVDDATLDRTRAGQDANRRDLAMLEAMLTAG